MAAEVLVTDYAWPDIEIEREILSRAGAELVVATSGEAQELVALSAGVKAILTNWKRVPAAALDAAPDCLVVSRYGVGVDNIPVERATELGVLVTNVPDFCLEEVSDHAMALLLACARRIVPFAGSTRAGEWNLELGKGLPRLRGQTLGLVGFGGIARALVPKALGFGLRILSCTPRLEPGSVPGGVEATKDLTRLLGESDYVSLHAPATAETRGLIGEAELRAMKPTAFLINTSRGALVDEQALERSLVQGWIAGAALDVLAREPADAENPLLGLDNVIVTPHVAFYSETSVQEVARKAAENVATVLRGDVPKTVVNPQVLRSDAYRLGRPRNSQR